MYCTITTYTSRLVVYHVTVLAYYSYSRTHGRLIQRNGRRRRVCCVLVVRVTRVKMCSGPSGSATLDDGVCGQLRHFCSIPTRRAAHASRAELLRVGSRHSPVNLNFIIDFLWSLKCRLLKRYYIRYFISIFLQRFEFTRNLRLSSRS